jgi:hypothetical protein
MEDNQLPSSTRSYEEWKVALRKLIDRKDPSSAIEIDDERVRPYYDKALMPYVCFKELFNT